MVGAACCTPLRGYVTGCSERRGSVSPAFIEREGERTSPPSPARGGSLLPIQDY